MTIDHAHPRGDGPATRALLVFLGGVAGTVIRLAVGALIVAPDASLVTTVAVDVTGAALLGGLYGITPPGDEHSARRRLLLGTGLLGGYTTYGTLVVGVDGLVLARDPLAGAAVALVAVTLGVGAAFVGEHVAVRVRKRART